MVPAELVEALIEGVINTMRDWHEDTDLPVNELVCVAALTIAEQMVRDMLLGDGEKGTLQ